MDWNDMATQWVAREVEMEAMLSPVLEAMMARATVAPGQRVLDVGCGMGASLARVLDLIGADGTATGLDISERMLTRAGQRFEGAPVELIVADAQTHALPSRHFDAAVSLFGTMFFDDSQAAFANLHSAMKPGAQLTFAAWGTRQDNPYFGMAGKIAMTRLGSVPKPPPDAPGPMRFGVPGPVLEMLGRAGWQGASVDTVALALTPQGTPDTVAANQMEIGAAPSVMAAKGGTPEDAVAIQAELAEALAQFDTEDGMRVPAVIHVFQATA
ncbi:MAG: class I SAM-dependent methyltransferase [Sedimentitalea sp.]